MISVVSDEGLPPGMMIVDSGGDRIAQTRWHPGGYVTPELSEDVRSFAETFPYLIRISHRGEPIRCECCGTLVALTPEARTGSRDTWEPAIWEYETYRKHTLRRCEWMRAQG